MTFLGLSYTALRLAGFAAVLATMMALELLAPRRRQSLSRRHRWPANLAMTVIGAVLPRLILPLAAIGVAELAAARGWGLLHQVAMPGWLAIVVAVIALDLIIYAQHVAFHAVPWLWRVHRMHHSDTAIDVTTALRFHPVEILISLAIKMAAIVLIGAPPVAVLIFEVMLNAAAMFNHANVALPAWLDRGMRLVLVTPDMHRVHHSVKPHETNSNYGFSLPWWDRLFGTYRAQPEDGHTGMTIGLDEFRRVADQGIGRLLMQPLKNAQTGRGRDG